MLWKLFWPKEAVKIIELYQNKGILNEEAFLFVANFHIKITIFVGILGIICSFGSKEVGFFFIAIIPFAIWFDARKIFLTQMAPYVYGKKEKVKFLSVDYYGGGRGIPPVLKSIYLTANNEKVYSTIGYKRFSRKLGLSKKEWPEKEGQFVDVYRVKNHPFVMPDIYDLKKKFSLNNQFNSLNSLLYLKDDAFPVFTKFGMFSKYNYLAGVVLIILYIYLYNITKF